MREHIAVTLEIGPKNEKKSALKDLLNLPYFLSQRQSISFIPTCTSVPSPKKANKHGLFI